MLKKALTSILCIFLFLIVFPAKQFNADTFTVTFDANGGLFNKEESIEVLVDTEKKIIDQDNWPNDPIKKGYDFDGYAIEDNKIDKDYLFEDNCTVKALWNAKKTNITLNIIDGKDGDISCVATYDSKMPDIVVPNKEGYNFVGYFDNDDVQYYDAFGKSLKIWDKEESEYVLFAKYEETNEESQEEPLLTGPLGAGATHVVTIDINGGILVDGIPEGWTKQDSNYTKQFAENTSIDDILLEWKDAVDKEGCVPQDVSWWNRSPYMNTLTGDITIKVTYYEACSISVNTVEHGTVELIRNKIEKNSWVGFSNNSIVSYYDDSKVFVKVTPEEGYVVDYWIINGVDEKGSDYYVKSNITVTPHVVQYYGVRALGKMVTVENYSDVLGDGTCSYNPETKELTLAHPGASTEGQVKYFYNGIISEHDLTINCLCNAIINPCNAISINGVSGAFSVACDGDLVINSEKKLKFDAAYGGNNAMGIFANNITINKGDVETIGNSFGAKALDTFTLNQENSPKFTCSSRNLVGLISANININGARVYGATEEYEEGVTNALYQLHTTPVIISFSTLPTQYDLWVGGTRITEENKDSEYNYQYDPNTKTLTIIGGSGSSTGYGIYCLDDLNIKVGNQDNAYISISSYGSSVTGESYGIYCEGDLTIDSDYQNVTLSPSSSNCARKSVAVFCDGRLTVKTKISALSGIVNNNAEGFAISAGVWARQGIDVIGNSVNTDYIYASAMDVKNNGYANYAILSGDGNPGYDKEATLNVTNARIYATVNDYTNSNASSYAVYSYGSINLNNGCIEANLDSYVNDDSSIIYSGDDMNMVNQSNVSCEDVGFFNEDVSIKGLEVNGTLTVDDSTIDIIETDEEYELSYIKLKKYQGIYAKNLIVKGEDTVIKSLAHKTVSGDSDAIYVTKQLTVDNGLIVAISEDAGGNSYGIYAGRDSFEGKHTIKNGYVLAISLTAQDGESVGLRTKKGKLDISGGTLECESEDYGLNSSDVITISKTSYEISPIIFAYGGEGNAAIKSKEVLVINDDASIINATTAYDPSSTCELFPQDDSSVKILYRRLASVDNVSMVYPENRGYYLNGDLASYAGTPHVYDIYYEMYADEDDFEASDFTYTYYKYDGQSYVQLSNAPTSVGSYKLVINCYSDYYEGYGDVFFDIFEDGDVAIKDNIISSSMNYNDNNIIDVHLDGISVAEAKKIFSDGSTISQKFLDAIDNNKKVTLVAEVNNIIYEDIFASKNINSNNAILLNVDFYALLEDGTKYILYNTGTFSPRISITVSENEANKIIGSNKKYYVYREHEGTITELDCIMRKDVNNYVFTFTSNKFSSFAVFSKVKQSNTKSSKRSVPNTSSL